MNILHYSLGFPPFRSGGMTKYCIDLMGQQINAGNSVSLLWPGRYTFINHQTRIVKRPKYSLSPDIKCGSFEILNPKPVPLLEGVKDVDAFTSSNQISSFDSFFEKNNLDVLHVHTLMGIPVEIVKSAKRCGARVVFTTHDYFGLCSKCNFMYGNVPCPDSMGCVYCSDCNSTALSLGRIRLLQSRTYKSIKGLSVVKRLRKEHISSLMNQYNTLSVDNTKRDTDGAKRYKKLREYYKQFFQLCDVIHCNSSNTKQVISSFLQELESYQVSTISNNEIGDHRHIKNYEENIIRLGYLGPASVRKGFYTLLECLDKVYSEHPDFTLTVYNSKSEREYIISNNPYSYSEIAKVMDGIDVLIVPSLCSETFGFTVLEALSYGVPVIVSEKVGAKDLVEQNKNGFIYKTEEELISLIDRIIEDKSILKDMNKYIAMNSHIKTMNEHAREISEMYKAIEV